MRTSKALFIALVAPVPVLALIACKKPPPPVPDAAPVVTAEPPEAAPLVAMEEDAGDDGAADAAPKKPGVWVDPKVARIKQCCAALRKQGATAPEVMLVAGQCDAIAAQASAKGTAPELGFLRQIKTIPPICQGL